MAYELNIEPKAERFMKKLKKINSDAASTIATHIIELKRDPTTPRPMCDLVKVRGSVDVYRLRIGKARVEYTVIDNE